MCVGLDDCPSLGDYRLDNQLLEDLLAYPGFGCLSQYREAGQLAATPARMTQLLAL